MRMNDNEILEIGHGCHSFSWVVITSEAFFSFYQNVSYGQQQDYFNEIKRNKVYAITSNLNCLNVLRSTLNYFSLRGTHGNDSTSLIQLMITSLPLQKDELLFHVNTLFSIKSKSAPITAFFLQYGWRRPIPFVGLVCRANKIDCRGEISSSCGGGIKANYGSES